MTQQGQSKGKQSQKSSQQEPDQRGQKGRNDGSVEDGATPQHEQQGTRNSQHQGGEHADKQGQRVGQMGQESGQGKQKQP